jgi:hypothetical protein
MRGNQALLEVAVGAMALQRVAELLVKAITVGRILLMMHLVLVAAAQGV